MDKPKEEVTITPEQAASFKGRVPRALAKQVKEVTAKKKLRTRKTKSGTITVSKPKSMDLFLEEYFKNGGNATQAAFAVFNCTSVSSASNIGSQYLAKARNSGLIRTSMERKGYSQDKMLDVAIEKMLESKTPEWWDRLMKMGEHADFMTKQTGPAVNVNVISAHKKYSSKYVIDGEDEIEGEIEESEEDDE